jgi:DNA repair protein RecO (recombination protein O)
VAPFHGGKLWIYHDPVRDSRKVSDFDVQSYRAGIRELYERAMAASAVAETILASHGGGGNWNEAARLAGSVLDARSEADAVHCPYLARYFLWHGAALLGARPDPADSASWTKLGPGGRLWLNKIETLPPGALARISMDTVSLEQVKAFTKGGLAAALGKWLPTWEVI